MKAMLLAAGEGSRLPETRRYGSKILVPVGGKPILEWNLLFLKKAGIRDVVINLCAGREKVLALLKRKKSLGLRIVVSCEDFPLGTAGGIKNAQALLGTKDFLVLYGDNLCDFDIRMLCGFHRKKRALGTLGVFDHATTRHSGILAGLVKVNEQGKVEKFLEKRNNQKIVQDGFVNAGVALFSPKIFDMIPEGKVCDLAKDIYPVLLRKRKRLFATEGATYVLASDTPEALRKTRRYFSKRMKR